MNINLLQRRILNDIVIELKICKFIREKLIVVNWERTNGRSRASNYFIYNKKRIFLARIQVKNIKIEGFLKIRKRKRKYLGNHWREKKTYIRGRKTLPNVQ